MKQSACKSLPVTMYHYVNELKGSITVSPERFEEHCRALAENGWRGVGLAEAEAYLAGEAPLPAKSLLLTFDDGFLDNYLYAMPILRKYGHQGVVFAVSQRLEAGDSPRFALDDVLAGTADIPEAVRVPMLTTSRGHKVRRDVFLNHAEARLADAHGTLALASHSRGHFGVCLSPDFTGFHKPGSQQRTFYLTEASIPWGMPKFTVRAGLLHRAFIPDPDMLEAVKKLVPQDDEGAADFFADEANEHRLAALVSGFSGRMGRFENDAERTARMWREIAGGKEELEAVLGHPVRSLCWPWGMYCEEAWNLAREAGFSVFFTTSEGVNPPGSAAAAHRFKGKDKGGSWLLSRSAIYARPLVGRIYAKMRL